MPETNLRLALARHSNLNNKNMKYIISEDSDRIEITPEQAAKLKEQDVIYECDVCSRKDMQYYHIKDENENNELLWEIKDKHFLGD